MKKLKILKGLFLSTLLLIGYFASAQTFTIEGTIVDSIAKRNLPSATISIVKAKDSALVSFARSNEQGHFTIKNIAAGSYLLSLSYVGYQQQWLAFKTGKNANINLNNIYLQDASTMSTVTVTARRAPVVINGDSIEFNAENFKTAPNAVVEDLLKKMPGIEVDKSGAITVNGKSVTKVFVNGKEFFTGDPKMATRNLPADAIDKIQVYDRKSDQAMFTGIDDGTEETAINLKIKKDRNQSNFGKLTGGAGIPGRYDFQGNLNRLNNDEQLSLIGGANNTNRQNFSQRDFSSFNGGGGGGRPGGGGGVTVAFSGGGGGGSDAGAQGVATTLSGGGNYSNVFNQKKTDFNANTSISDIERFNKSNSYTQNLTPGNLFNRSDISESTSKNKQQSFGMTLDQKVTETFSFKLTPSIGQSNSSSISNSSSETFLPDGTMTNSSKTHSTSATDATNFSNTLLLRKKFAKKGRTISSTITNGYNQSTSNGTQNTEQLFYTLGNITKDSLLDQRNTRKGSTTTYSANVVYTEPLGKKSLLEMNAYFSKSIGNSSKKVYDSAGNFETLNTRLTNEFNSDYTYTGGGMNYRTNQRKFNFSTGFSLQNAKLNGENVSAKTLLNQDFKDILPSAMFQYNFSQTKNLNINYRTSTNQPSLTQLQPVLDQSNINRQTIGNPDLKRSYVNNLNIRFFSSKIISQRNFFALLNASSTNNSIVNYDSILPSRVTLSKPVNVNGSYRVNGSVNYGFGLKKIHSRLNFGLSTGFSNNISYTNSLLNTIVTKSYGPSFTYNFQLEDVVDIDLSARYSFSNTSNKITPTLNTNYLTRVYGADVTNYLPFNFVINQSFNYTINSGRAAGFNTAIPIWNASFSKFFMKNKRAEIKASAFDILNKNAGISRNVSQNQIVDQNYNVINQYFLLSFIYSLQKSGLGGGNKSVMIRMN
ncbi:MAG: outer membrane beta-barrel protein [Chitinophagia bacterium]|jgi:Outer membrane protein beta-barrel family/Carboxypeptidase regulatory-like domain